MLGAGGAWRDGAVLNALPGLVWVADPDGTITYLNRRFEEYLGTTLEGLGPQGWVSSVHPDDGERAVAGWRDAVAGDTEFTAEYRVRRADGAYRWHEDRGAVVRDADDQVVGWCGTLTDVHERRLTQESLAELQRRAEEQAAFLDALHEHAPIGLGFLDRELRLTHANAALAAISTVPPEELLGRHLSDLAPSSWPRLQPLLNKVLTEGISLADVSVREPDGDDPDQLREWLLDYYPVELDGQRLGVGVTVREVTAQRERERALARTRQLLLDAEQVASIGSFDYDIATSTSTLSLGLQEMLETDEPETTLEAALARLHPDDRAEGRHRAGGPEAAEEPVGLSRLVRKDGTTRTVEVRRHVRMGPDGQPERIYGTVQDVTERVAAEAEAQLWADVAETVPVALTVLQVDPDTGDLLGDALPRRNRMARRLGTERGASEPASGEVDRVRAAIVEAIRRREPVEVGELTRTDPSLGTRTLDVTVYALPGRETVAVVGADVTAVQRLEAERVELLVRSVSAADEERRRIAEHLHDDAIQALTAAMLRVDHALDTGSLKPLEPLRAALEAAMRSLRLTVLELTPPALSPSGVGDALQTYAAALFDNAPVDVSLDLRLDDDAVIDPDILIAGVRITQEALVNVRKHAAASQVRVRLVWDGGELAGEVSDDGAGASEVAERPGHLGIRLMRERAEILGGRCEIVSEDDGGGTLVRWSIPANGAGGAQRKA